MESIAATFRRSQIETDRKLSFLQRIELSFRCLDSDAELYASANRVTREQALDAFRRNRQEGRRPSQCLAGR